MPRYVIRVVDDIMLSALLFVIVVVADGGYDRLCRYALRQIRR